MHINYETKIHDFLSHYEKILIEKEALHQLILNNAYFIKKSEQQETFIFGAIHNDQNDPCVIFLYMPPYNLILDQVAPIEREWIIHFAKDIYKKNDHLPGINANKAISDAFIHTYAIQSQTHPIKHLSMDIMMLESLNQVSLRRGTFRPVQNQDLEMVDDFVVKFTKEATHEDVAYEDVHNRNIERLKLGHLYLFENEQKEITSIGQIGRFLNQTVSINLIYTHPNYRNQGYGTTIVWHLCQKIFELGYHYPTLFVDQKNPISNHVYIHLGFRIISSNYDYRFKHIE